MSDIKEGDIVQVMFTPKCCKREGMLGKIYEVRTIERNVIGTCTMCGTETIESIATFPDSFRGIQLYRLRKISPFSELENKTDTRDLKRKRSTKKVL